MLKAVRVHFAREWALAMSQVRRRTESDRSAQLELEPASDAVGANAVEDEFLADNYDRIVAALPKRVSLSVRSRSTRNVSRHPPR